MGKKRGRPQTHWAKDAQLWAWYWILRETGVRDYELDLKFAWRPEARESNDPVERPRVFENIRKSAHRPSGTDSTRSMREVVEAIENSGRFSGAGDLYDSKLWELFQVRTPDAEQFVDDFEHFLSKHALVRVDPLIEPFGDVCFTIGKKNFIERCLMLSLQNLPLVDKCEFLWRLFLQAKLNSSNETLPFIESILDQCLDLFFYRYLNKSNYLSFYRSAVHAMLTSQIQFERSTSLHYVGKIGGWAIIPERQVHSLSPADLAKVPMIIDYISASA